MLLKPPTFKGLIHSTFPQGSYSLQETQTLHVRSCVGLDTYLLYSTDYMPVTTHMFYFPTSTMCSFHSVVVYCAWKLRFNCPAACKYSNLEPILTLSWSILSIIRLLNKLRQRGRLENHFSRWQQTFCVHSVPLGGSLNLTHKASRDEAELTEAS